MNKIVKDHKKVEASHNTQVLKYSYGSSMMEVNPSPSRSSSNNVVDALDALISFDTTRRPELETPVDSDSLRHL
jgi:hypothetical protein